MTPIRITAFLIGFVLAFAYAVSAHAVNNKQVCNGMSVWVGTAMDARLSGQPAHETRQLAEAAGVPDVLHDTWHVIVDEVYKQPRHFLRGANRADFLTAFYTKCVELMQEQAGHNEFNW